MYPLIRLALMLGALLVALAIVVSHGTRGLLFLIAVGVIAAAPRTRAWQTGERWLVRLTGSRGRAAALVMLIMIGAATAVDLYQLVR